MRTTMSLQDTTYKDIHGIVVLLSYASVSARAENTVGQLLHLVPPVTPFVCSAANMPIGHLFPHSPPVNPC